MFLRLKKLFKTQSGRSMIEMLGVLAIIGVLSVGGIAGYNKAMDKYKTNEIVKSYSLLIGGLLQHYDDLIKLPNGSDLIYYAQKLDIMPKVQRYTSSSGGIPHFEDIVGNIVRLYVITEGYTGTEKQSLSINLGFSSKNEDIYSFNTDLCISMYKNLLIPLHEELGVVRLYRGETKIEGGSYYGNQYCGKNKKCLVHMSLTDVRNICSNCLSDSVCALVIRF